MSKSKKQKQAAQKNQLIMGAVAVAVVLGLGLVALLSGGGSSSEGSETIALISPADYDMEFAQGDSEYYLLDVRTPGEFATGYIEGAANIAVESLQSRISEVPEGMPIVVYCNSGNRSQTASRILAEAGFTEVYDLGGIQQWRAAGYPTIQ